MKASVFKEKGLLAVEALCQPSIDVETVITDIIPLSDIKNLPNTPKASDKQYVTCPSSALNWVEESLEWPVPEPS
ncbi:hypothetical protein ACFLTR_02000 [Chloroflexota bacterium]